MPKIQLPCSYKIQLSCQNTQSSQPIGCQLISIKSINSITYISHLSYIYISYKTSFYWLFSKKAIILAFSYLMTWPLPTLPCNAYKLLWYLPLVSVEQKKCHLNVILLFLKGTYNFNIISRVYIELYILFCPLLNTGNTFSLLHNSHTQR